MQSRRNYQKLYKELFLQNRKVWARKRRKRVERKNVQEDKLPSDYIVWLRYFKQIKNVCPWSYKSFIAGTTNIVPFNLELLIENESNWNERPWEVIIYLMGDDYTLDNMDSITEYRNEVQNTCEYLWSHPSFSKGGNNQAPKRIIIQQDRARLMELRHGKKKKSS